MRKYSAGFLTLNELNISTMKTLSVKFLLSIFFSLAISVFVFGQNKTLVGKVTTFDRIPLTGVEIEVKNIGLVVLTDSLGRFQTFCNDEDKLTVRANGVYDQKVRVEIGIRMIFVNLKLKKGDKKLDLAIT